MKIASLASLVLLTGCWFSAEPRHHDDEEPAPSSTTAPTGTSTPATPQVASTAAPGTCAPAAECGGITSCNDYCYGKDCCTLQCSCGSADDRTHLYCQQTCH